MSLIIKKKGNQKYVWKVKGLSKYVRKLKVLTTVKVSLGGTAVEAESVGP